MFDIVVTSAGAVTGAETGGKTARKVSLGRGCPIAKDERDVIFYWVRLGVRGGCPGVIVRYADIGLVLGIEFHSRGMSCRVCSSRYRIRRSEPNREENSLATHR